MPTELINITTGQVANAEVRERLNTFQECGTLKCKTFLEDKLAETTKSKSFWDPEPRQKPHTFSDIWLYQKYFSYVKHNKQ